MTRWDKVVANVDTPGGHILVCLLLIGIGVVLLKVGIAKGEDLIVGATSVLWAAFRGDAGRLRGESEKVNSENITINSK